MAIRPVLVGLAIGVLLVGAGCRSGKPMGASKGSLPSAPAASNTPTLVPRAIAERDGLAAYRGMWSTFVDAARTSDPEASELHQYAADQALRLIATGLYADRKQGKITKGTVGLTPKVTGARPAEAPTEVTVSDCVDTTTWLVYRASGQLWDDQPGGRHRTTATVKRAGGDWKVSSFILEESGTC